MTKKIWMVILCGLAFGFASLVRAQNSNAGDIRGTVSDSSGAVVPGATVTVTDNDTGVVNRYLTNGDGLYDTNSILPGTYTLEFSKTGFESYKRSGLQLQVGIVTVNATLKVGSSTETVQVSSDAPLLKTEDAQVSTTLGTKQLNNLPSFDPEGGYTYLLKLLPGATSTPGGTNGGGAGDQEPQFDQAINGTMPYFASYLVDGGSIWLPHSANVNQGLSEVVSELNVIASDAPAQYGGGGSVFNVITKTGSNQFHGSLYDYFQNDDMDARDYFDRPPVGKNKLRYNYFGGAIGGPIVKNKMFFYYNYQELRNPQSSISVSSQPTAAMKAGCFDPAVFGADLKLDAAHGGAPLTTNPAQCGAYNAADLALPTADFDSVASNIQNDYYLASQGPETSVQNNYSYLNPATNEQTKMFGRLDYNVTAKNRIDFSIVEEWAPAVLSQNVNDNSPNCPVNCNINSSDGGNAQISDVWTISSNIVNEARFSMNRGANYDAIDALNKGITGKIGLGFSTADVLPTVSFSGTGAPTSISPGTEALFIQNTFDPSDVVTWIKGKHILHFGGEVLMEEDNSTPWGGINGATVSFTGQFTTSDPTVSETGYADFLLGDVQGWNTTTYGKHYMRAKNPSFFVQDDFKLRPNLTLNLGVRSETHGGASEKYNQAGGFDPTLANPVPSPGVVNGVNYPVNANGSIWFAGLNGERTQSYATKTLVMPRLGFAWTLGGGQNWVVRGGVGQYSSLWSEDTVGGTMGFGSGAVGSASAGTSPTSPVVQLDYANNGFAEHSTTTPLPIVSGATARTPSEYITPLSPQGSGGSIPYTPYHLPIQNGWQWTFGVQHRLPQNMVAEAQYIGAHWSNMMFEADDNQLSASNLGCPTNTANQNACRPYPQFAGIGIASGGSRTGTYNGISNYQSAQFSLNMPNYHGLSLDVAYTWSQLKDDMDDSGWGNQFGSVYYQDAYNPAANYGLSNFNRPNSLKGTLVYGIPLGKGHQYLNSTLADAALGGWQVSGDFLAESGVPFTVIMSNPDNDGSLGFSDQAGADSIPALYPNKVGNPSPSNQSLSEWFNPAAYAAPATDTFGTNPRNSLRGPDLTDFDFALAKTWGIPGWESGKLMLRSDAINVFNHPSFQNPNNTIGGGNPGVISASTITGRTMMLTGRFEF